MRPDTDIHVVSPAITLISPRALELEHGFSPDAALKFLASLGVGLMKFPDGEYFWLFAYEMALMGALLPKGTFCKEDVAKLLSERNEKFPGKHVLRSAREKHGDPEAFARLLCVISAYYGSSSLAQLRKRVAKFGEALIGRALESGKKVVNKRVWGEIS